MSPEPQNGTAPVATQEQTPDWFKNAPIISNAPTPSSGQSSQPETFTDKVMSYWHSLWNDVGDYDLIGNAGGRNIEATVGNQKVSIHQPNVRAQLEQERQQNQEVIDYEVNHAHPYRAALAQMYYGTLDDATNLALSFATPKQIALTIASDGENVALKTFALMANVYFAWRGSQAMFTGKQQGETDADALQRRLLGAATAAGGAAGTVATSIDAVRGAVRGHLGLDGDLAAKVEDKITAANERKTAASAEIASTEQIGQGIQDQITKQQLPLRMGQVMADAAQVVQSENARVSNLFDDLTKRSTVPVSDATDLRAEIMNTLSAHGIQDAEIPQRIFDSLPQRVEPRALTASETKGAAIVSSLQAIGASTDDMREALKNRNLAPKQMDAIMAVAAPLPNAPIDVNFKTATRISGDLYDASESFRESNPELARALREAKQNIDGMRERYANDQGFGPSYRKANAEYMKFKRELGSGLMEKFLKAYDVEDEAMLKRVAKIISPTSGEALRDLFKSAGVDTSPISDLVADRKAAGLSTKQNVKAIGKRAAADIAKIGTADSIIPGQSDFELAGMGNEQIKRAVLGKLVNNAREGGITHPHAYIQIMFGLARMTEGSLPERFVAHGATLAIERLVHNKNFQDWVIAESGVSTPNVTRFRESIAKSYPILRRMAQSTVLPRATDTAQKQKNEVRPLAPQPTQPIRPPSKPTNIRIAP